MLTFITFTEWQGTFLLNSFIVYEMCSSVLGALDPLVVWATHSILRVVVGQSCCNKLQKSISHLKNVKKKKKKQFGGSAEIAGAELFE